MKEGANFGAEDSAESTSSSTKKKKNLGHVAAESSDRGRDERRGSEKSEAERRSIFDSFDKQKPSKTEDLSPEPQAEAKAPTDEIEPKEEVPFAVQKLAEGRLPELEAEKTDGSDEAEAAKAAAILLHARVAEGEPLDVAASEVESMIDASNDDVPELMETLEPADQAEIEADIDAADGPEEFGEEGELILRETAEASADGAGGTGSSGAVGGSGNSGNGGMPPFGPGGPSGYGAPGGPGGPPYFGGGLNPNLAPAAPATTPNTVPRAPEYDAGNPAVTALIGGIVGYLIGRRRGRIKTEKKLLPIQKKLEKQVVNLDWQLREKETKIRRLAAEQVRTRGGAVSERIRQQATERQQQRQQAPEAHQLHGNKRQQEHIGHMLVAAEAPLAARQPKPAPEIVGTYRLEKKSEITSEVAAASGKRIETLNRAELMSLSEKIIVDGSSLRQIYKSHLIGERGLRRLVNEHLRGGDLKKALRLEITEREIDFERDPAMRDRADATGTPVARGGGKTALDTLLQKAEAGLPSGSEEAAFYKARARYDVVQHEQEQKQRRLIDVSLTAIIVILLTAVAYIFLTRG